MKRQQATGYRQLKRSGFRRLACCLLPVACCLLGACAGTDEFNLFGYSTRSQYAGDIRTVRVPIFENRTFVRGIEFQLTEAVIKQIEAKTHWKVVKDCNADSELIGAVIAVPKRVITQNRLNEVREAELSLAVEVRWRDLRTGQILSAAGPLDPTIPVTTPLKPVLVQRSAPFIVELGESLATAKKEVVDDLAEQIVSMMEVPW